jgi:Carboxypeptidase regulatory-like domain
MLTLNRLMKCLMWGTIAGPSNAGRLVGAVCLILLGATCRQNDPSPSANPVGPAAPTPSTVPTLTLSGVVAEDGHPIENANVGVSGLQACSSGCSFRQFHAGSGMTDAAGRYRIIITRPEDATATVWAMTRKDGYAQQCVATTTMQADASLDLRLTSIANLSAARPLSAPGSRTVSGVVFEDTATGKQPVEGASVGWEGLSDTTLAETRSDAAGRYLLCGLPLGRTSLFAVKQGYSSVSVAPVEAGTDAVVDIVITRR